MPDTETETEFEDLEGEDFDIIFNNDSKKNEESEEGETQEPEPEESESNFKYAAAGVLSTILLTYLGINLNNYLLDNNLIKKMGIGRKLNVNGIFDDLNLDLPIRFSTPENTTGPAVVGPVVIHEDSPPEIAEDEKTVISQPPVEATVITEDGDVKKVGRRFSTIYETEYNPAWQPFEKKRERRGTNRVFNQDLDLFKDVEDYIDELERQKDNNQYRGQIINKKRELLGAGQIGSSKSLTDIIEDYTVYGKLRPGIEFIPSDDA